MTYQIECCEGCDAMTAPDVREATRLADQHRDQTGHVAIAYPDIQEQQ